jgi:Na+-driven multidrug efflux pump
MSLAQATGIIVAQLLGRGAHEAELDAFLRRAWRVTLMAAGVVSLTYMAFTLASGWIYNDLQTETRQALISFLPFLMLMPFPKGSNAICGQALRASGDSVAVMNIFIAGQWVFKVPLTFLFIVYLDMSVAWVFSLFLFEELFKFPMFHKRLLRGDWKRAQATF